MQIPPLGKNCSILWPFNSGYFSLQVFWGYLAKKVQRRVRDDQGLWPWLYFLKWGTLFIFYRWGHWRCPSVEWRRWVKRYQCPSEGASRAGLTHWVSGLSDARAHHSYSLMSPSGMHFRSCSVSMYNSWTTGCGGRSFQRPSDILWNGPEDMKKCPRINTEIFWE